LAFATKDLLGMMRISQLKLLV